MLLEDEDLLNRVNQLISQGCSAASAMEQAAAQIAADFAAQSSEYLQARKADVVDACRRVVGIPLPLISYGGTVMFSIMSSFGIILCMKINQDNNINFAAED